jgi:hypothetical protein
VKPLKVIAGLAIAGGVTVGAMGAVGVGVSYADPGLAKAPIPADWPPPGPPGPPGPHGPWGPPPPGPQWGGPGPGGPWGPPPPPPPDGTWNGGWEPDGGICLFGACV